MNINKILGAILLISSTTIGGGVLALPASTFVGGMIPATITFLICWFFMTCGALYLLEVTLWSQQETNLISMAKHSIGLPGQIIAWLAYMFLLYALICAYLLSASAWLITLLQKYFGLAIGIEYALPSLGLLIGIIVLAGVKVTDYANRIFSIGLVITYIVLIAIILPHVSIDQFITNDITVMPATTPLIVTTFGYAIVIPTLAHYLQRNTKDLLYAVVIGSIIPLIVYLLWEFVTLGTLSAPGPHSLAVLAEQHADGTQIAIALENTLAVQSISTTSQFFSIFCIVTSLLGVSLSLFHFLADGLKVAQRGKSGLMLFALTFIPPMLIIAFYPAGFDKILSFGGIFVAVLLGILPALMVWFGRDQKQQQASFKIFGGKPLLLMNLIFFSYIVGQEIYNFI